MLKKQMRVPRGTARRIRRDAAKEVFNGKGFSIYWNHGNPTSKSFDAAVKFRADNS